MSLLREDIGALGAEVENRLRRILGVKGADDAVTGFAVQHLRERGYNISESRQNWESKKEFMARLGLENHDSVNRDIRLWRKRGGTILTYHGASGKLMEILSNTDFDAFCKRHKSPSASSVVKR
jgi:hypothetical protein